MNANNYKAKFRVGPIIMLVLFSALVVLAQDPTQFKEMFARSRQQNAQALKQYVWKSRNEVRKNGESKSTQVFLMRYDALGDIQRRTSITNAGEVIYEAAQPCSLSINRRSSSGKTTSLRPGPPLPSPPARGGNRVSTRRGPQGNSGGRASAQRAAQTQTQALSAHIMVPVSLVVESFAAADAFAGRGNGTDRSVSPYSNWPRTSAISPTLQGSKTAASSASRH